jgi:RTX calcium-binding nonapeptide repeat (4 copies)
LHAGTLKPFGRAWLARLALLSALALLALLSLPGAAPAQGLVTGFSDPFHYQANGPSDRAAWLNRTSASGAGIVRLAIEWPGIVGSQRPSDPTNPGSASYNFSAIDGPVRDVEARGLKVLLTVNRAPAWAEAPGRPPTVAPGTWKPNPGDLANFLQAVAARYSGGFRPAGQSTPLPAVQALEVWDEANSSDWLNPVFQGTTALSPDYYRAMLNTSYRAIKAVNPRMLVVVAGTDPYGDPPGGPYHPGTYGPTQRVYPVQFWEQLLCVHPVTTTTTVTVKAKKKKGKKRKKKRVRRSVTSYARTQGCPAPALFDVFAHHPIDNTGGGPLKSGPSPGDVSTPDLGRLVSVLRGAEAAGTTLPGAHPVWVTEFWWDSNPPNPVGADLLTQARWIEQSLYLFWKAGADTAINFQVGDVNERPDVHAGLQAGVYFIDGRPKPSLTAFRFPFVTERINKQTLRAWGKAPEGGTLQIQRQQGADWVTIKTLQVGKGAVFDTELQSSVPFPATALRATVGASQSVVWQQSEPPPSCKGKPATIVGTNGRDVRKGTSGKDVMVGLGGSDTLSGLAGNDVICGGAGKDTLKGGKGSDKLLGGAGKDTLKGGPGNDKLKGGAGKDKQAQ